MNINVSSVVKKNFEISEKMCFFDFIGDLLLSKLLWLTVIALGSLYYYLTLQQDYFEKIGVKFIKPLPLFGNMLPTILGKDHFINIFNNFYLKYPDEKLE